MSQLNLGVIGAGNMASAIIKGVIRKGKIEPENIYVYDIDANRQSQLVNQTSVTPARSNSDLIKRCKIIIIAVKPNVYKRLLDEIVDSITKQHLLISIAAGISTDFINKKIDNRCKVIRVMPNTPALIGEGMSVICSNSELNKYESKMIHSIFSSLGRVEMVDEALINGVTAISGSSPAYIYMFIEALADGGVMMGLPRDQAYRIAAQSVLGSAKMVLELNEHPAVLKDMVCSPGGTTIEAIYTLEKNSFRGSVMEAVRNCALKAEQIDRRSNRREREETED
ncbi:MAG: pyrroline-5-carboxylate reductase [Clostridiales bacterium]|nr:pyrroline-5-carboxylate reductase [Clostridiales bacterium]